jgi:hypothetical protein
MLISLMLRIRTKQVIVIKVMGLKIREAKKKRFK